MQNLVWGVVMAAALLSAGARATVTSQVGDRELVCSALLVFGIASLFIAARLKDGVEVISPSTRGERRSAFSAIA